MLLLLEAITTLSHIEKQSNKTEETKQVSILEFIYALHSGAPPAVAAGSANHAEYSSNRSGKDGDITEAERKNATDDGSNNTRAQWYAYDESHA
mmetsp:Transcript_2662/g.2692  ORF Transcript_2662/g.2692 Transcript_2662/m.2692 type:complete len:94 (-) Transcript_2662:132-413(-)|eukprot:CAMPEP_0171324408 /NCGR_PEP_ID=MMETSP0816-20121228/116165_1 /TAXON_ID=420281 /ORGANISM="Proboscia inermis, Strain CCAP1064/1" /LENGTH=93 /DNA_ID=CAMNT_0011823327 /DNA_START=703 /DNA_END=984 /DNA_ORIENTATION=+